ncbi:uncharacterized protein LOC114657184 isoform X2 [Erpetoichthys calabaricus]|uniref:uncharacterized protein LOC114657184 isoform X2 n=1 Tax=Erpetoichthys calabaricus TaxID=27687 RepID=UPI0022344F3F|nr:uncharacterized protein LOC114657184 isoform X2 [Erpetoichthys calabaricus]
MPRGDTETGKQEAWRTSIYLSSGKSDWTTGNSTTSRQDTESSCCLKIWTAIALVLFGGLLAAYRVVEYRWILRYQGNISEEIPWRKFNDRLYYFEKNNKLKWEAAAEFCRKHKATLIVFREQNDWEGNKEFISNHSVGSIWIGYTREPGKTWHWVHEAKINTARYRPKILQDNDGNNCANMMNKEFFAAPCKSHHFFICEKYLSVSDSVV